MMDVKVALIGNLAGGASMMLTPLRAKGVDAHLFLARWESGLARPVNVERIFGERRVGWLHEYGCKHNRRLGPMIKTLQLILSQLSMFPTGLKLIHFDLVQSFTGSLFLSPFLIFLFGILRKRPYIACGTGSDIREVAVQDGLKGKWMRFFLGRAARTLLLNLDMVELMDKIGLKNAQFFPFMIDTEKFRPDVVKREYVPANQILFFMPSHLDWGVVDNAPGRNSTKGNDRFIRAFAKFVKTDGPAHAVLLERGPDRGIAKEMVAQLGISPYVTFLPELNKDELIRHFQMADIVVDQFDVGAFGTTGLEAMACAKPVMIYIKNHCADMCYPERPPVMNARTEDAIYEQMKIGANKNYREEIGQKAREWILRYHDSEKVADRLINVYEDILQNWKR
jgi:glycosyltransferase involved in cell wall biosynthesis